MVVINKADGDLLPAARRIMGEYLSAVKFTRSKSSHWRTKVRRASIMPSQPLQNGESAVTNMNHYSKTSLIRAHLVLLALV